MSLTNNFEQMFAYMKFLSLLTGSIYLNLICSSCKTEIHKKLPTKRFFSPNGKPSPCLVKKSSTSTLFENFMKFTRFPTVPLSTENGGVHTLVRHSNQAICPSIPPATFSNTNDQIVQIISLIFNNKPLRIVFYFYQIKLSFVNKQ